MNINRIPKAHIIFTAIFLSIFIEVEAWLFMPVWSRILTIFLFAFLCGKSMKDFVLAIKQDDAKKLYESEVLFLFHSLISSLPAILCLLLIGN